MAQENDTAEEPILWICECVSAFSVARRDVALWAEAGKRMNGF